MIHRRVVFQFTSAASKTLAALIASFASLWPSLAGGVEKDPPVLFYNARIFTAEPTAPYANAVAIQGGRIVAVGTQASVQRSVGPSARRIDLGGRFLMPGMIDAHAHPIGSQMVVGGGSNLVLAHYDRKTYSLTDLVSFVGKTVDTGNSMMGDTVVVNGIDPVHWAHSTDIDRELSSGRFSSTPVILFGSDGHTAWANKAARTRAGMSANYVRTLPAQEQAFFGMDSAGNPNGFVVDGGLTRLRASVPRPSVGSQLNFGRAGVKHLNSLGVTGWLDAAAAGAVGGDIPLSLEDQGVLPVYRELARRDELTAHVAAFPVIRPNDGHQQLGVVEKLRREYAGVKNLTIPGFKVFADGVVEFPAQTAALTKPYLNTGHSAPVLFDREKFKDLVVEADRRHLTLHIHAIGNLAVKQSLDAIGAARQANPGGTLPHTLTHLEFVDDDDLSRFALYRVNAVLQLLWALADPSTIEQVKPYVDPSIYSRIYPARSLLEAGANVAGASDWPVSSPNPFEAMYQAETRVGPQGVLTPEQRMPRIAMLFAYTRNAAVVLGRQQDIGSITVGKRADLVLVDRDVLTVPSEELRDAKVLWTMFGGKVVHGIQP